MASPHLTVLSVHVSVRMNGLLLASLEQVQLCDHTKLGPNVQQASEWGLWNKKEGRWYRYYVMTKAIVVAYGVKLL